MDKEKIELRKIEVPGVPCEVCGKEHTRVVAVKSGEGGRVYLCGLCPGVKKLLEGINVIVFLPMDNSCGENLKAH